MTHFKGYVTGWLDSSVHDFLGEFPPNSTSAAFALITCLDSNLEPRSVLHAHRELKKNAKRLNGGLLVPSAFLRDARIRDELFVGFDEIWFFPSEAIKPKPKSVSIIGPARIDQAKIDKLGDWMMDSHCSLALGDGDGLNVIVKAHGLVRNLIAHSMFQHEPARPMAYSWVQDEEKKSPEKSPAVLRKAQRSL